MPCKNTICIHELREEMSFAKDGWGWVEGEDDVDHNLNAEDVQSRISRIKLLK